MSFHSIVMNSMLLVESTVEWSCAIGKYCFTKNNRVPDFPPIQDPVRWCRESLGTSGGCRSLEKSMSSSCSSRRRASRNSVISLICSWWITSSKICRQKSSEESLDPRTGFDGFFWVCIYIHIYIYIYIYVHIVCHIGISRVVWDIQVFRRSILVMCGSPAHGLR